MYRPGRMCQVLARRLCARACGQFRLLSIPLQAPPGRSQERRIVKSSPYRHKADYKWAGFVTVGAYALGSRLAVKSAKGFPLRIIYDMIR